MLGCNIRVHYPGEKRNYVSLKPSVEFSKDPSLTLKELEVYLYKKSWSIMKWKSSDFTVNYLVGMLVCLVMNLANKGWAISNITLLSHVSFLSCNKPLLVLLSCIISASHRVCIKKDFQTYSSVNVKLLIILQITPCIGNHLWWTQYMEIKCQHTLCACAQICSHVCINCIFSEYQREFF